MAAIGPLELAEALYLRVLQLSSVDVVLVLFGGPTPLIAFDRLPPLLEAFAEHFLTNSEGASYFDCSELELLHSLSSHLVPHPVTIVL